ncbi:MAG: hypothetical protein ACYCQI_09020 [Gammaproteobacteria bacterium]
MRNFIFTLLIAIVGFSASAAFADTTVVEQGYGVPITVQKDVYTVQDPDYYYYSGHRCYTKERPDIGVSFLGLHAGVGGGSSEIYCYNYP